MDTRVSPGKLRHQPRNDSEDASCQGPHESSHRMEHTSHQNNASKKNEEMCSLQRLREVPLSPTEMPLKY